MACTVYHVFVQKTSVIRVINGSLVFTAVYMETYTVISKVYDYSYLQMLYKKKSNAISKNGLNVTLVLFCIHKKYHITVTDYMDYGHWF